MTLRIPPKLESKLRDVTNEEGTTLTGEIIKRLNESFSLETTDKAGLKYDIKESAEMITRFANKIVLMTENSDEVKNDLTPEEIELINLFKNAKADEKALISSLLKKLS